MLDDEPRDCVQFVSCESSIFRKCNWPEPELGNLSISLYMNVRRFLAIGTEEDEAVWSVDQYRRHGCPSN
jgi:hypothetical protein